MEYEHAENLAIQQQLPVRRSSWPEGHHVRHHLEESSASLKLHTPDSPQASTWQAGSEDQAAHDWEQFIPTGPPTQQEQ